MSLHRTRRRALGLRYLMFLLPACTSISPAEESTRTSRILWAVSPRGWGVPAIDENAAYFLTPDHQMIVVNRSDGRILDRHTLFAGLANPPGFTVIRAGRMVAAVDNGVLYAFSLAGQPARAWTFRPPTGGLEDWISSDGTTIYAGSSDARVYAIDAATGAARWVTTITSASEAQTRGPRLRDGAIYVSFFRSVAPAQGGVASVDAATGALRWVRNIEPASPGRPAGSHDIVAFLDDGNVAATADDGRIYSLAPDTGIPPWIVPSLTGIPKTWGGDPAQDSRPLTVSAGLLVAGSTTGYFVGLDQATGNERWRSRADQGSAIFPLVTDGRLVYATHFGGQLAAFDAATGAVRWIDGRRSGAGMFAQGPALDGNVLYLSGFDKLYALRAGE